MTSDPPARPHQAAGSPPAPTARPSEPPTMPRRPSTRIRAALLGLSAISTVAVATAAQQALTESGTLDGHTEAVYSVAFSPDGKQLITGGFDNTVRVWDLATKKELKRFDGHTSFVLSVAPSPDGKRILSGSLDKTAKIWDIPSEAPSKVIEGVPAGIHALTNSPDGKLAAVATGPLVKILDVAAANSVRDLTGHAAEVESLAW